jgi:hypothetical protein
MSLKEKILSSHSSVLTRERAAANALTDQRRRTCNTIARMLRKMGFPDAVAEQSDTGRRDVTFTFMGHGVIVGVFHNGAVRVLPPLSGFHGTGWTLVKDLPSLPLVVSSVLRTALKHGLKQKSA